MPDRDHPHAPPRHPAAGTGEVSADAVSATQEREDSGFISLRRHRVIIFTRRIFLSDGFSAHLDTLIAGLAAEGHEAVIVTGTLAGQDVMPERFARLRQNTRAIRVLEDVAPGTGESIGAVTRFLLREARAFRPTLIHAHGLSSGPSGWLAARAQRRCGLVVTSHVLEDDIGTKRVLAQRIASLLSADAYIAISSDLADFYRNRLRIAPRKVHLVYNGISEALYRPPSPAERQAARAAFGIAPTALVVTVPARLDRSKGHHLAIAALRELARTDEIVALFPGIGNDAEAIRELALRTDADRHLFRFVGQLPDLVELFRAADISLLPSRNEGFGLVVAEGMMSGSVPVRTPSAGAFDQIEDGVDGFIVPFDDPDAIVERLRLLRDPALRARMSAAAVRKATGLFSSRAMLRGTLTAYDAAATARGA